MKKICYKVVLTKDFDGVDIMYSIHKDLTFDSLDEASKAADMYVSKLNCRVSIYEMTSELISYR